MQQREDFDFIEQILTQNEKIVNGSRSISELEKAKKQIDEILHKLDNVFAQLEDDYYRLREELGEIYEKIQAERQKFEAISAHNAQLVNNINAASDKITQSVKEFAETVIGLHDLLQQLAVRLEKFENEFITANEKAREIIKNAVAEAAEAQIKQVLNEFHVKISRDLNAQFNRELQNYKSEITNYIVFLAFLFFFDGFVLPLFIEFIMKFARKFFGG